MPIRAARMRPRTRRERASRTGGRVAADSRPQWGRGPTMRRRADRRLFGGNAAEVGPGNKW